MGHHEHVLGMYVEASKVFTAPSGAQLDIK